MSYKDGLTYLAYQAGDFLKFIMSGGSIPIHHSYETVGPTQEPVSIIIEDTDKEKSYLISHIMNGTSGAKVRAKPDQFSYDGIKTEGGQAMVYKGNSIKVIEYDHDKFWKVQILTTWRHELIGTIGWLRKAACIIKEI